MSLNRARIDQILGSEGLGEETMGRLLARVVRAEVVKETFVPDDEGRMHLTRRVVLHRPEDAARGALVLDYLTGGSLGLAPANLGLPTLPEASVLRKFAPEPTRRVIDVGDPSSTPPPVGVEGATLPCSPPPQEGGSVEDS